MHTPAFFTRHPSCKLAGVVLVALVLGGCAQLQRPGYYDKPHDSTLSDAQYQAQGGRAAQAPAQVQLGFGSDAAAKAKAAQAAAEEKAPVTARPLAEAKTFLGTVPCLVNNAGCSATRVTLTLAPDGQWRSRTVELDQPDAKTAIAEQGCWNVVGTRPLRIVLQLPNEATKANLTFVNDNVLRINTINDLKPTLDHHLTRQADIDPIDEIKASAAVCQ